MPQFISRLHRIDEADESDFDVDEPGVYERLLKAQQSKQAIVVTSVEVVVDGGETDYYNIKLSDGYKFDAISGFHIVGIEQFRKDTAGQAI